MKANRRVRGDLLANAVALALIAVPVLASAQGINAFSDPNSGARQQLDAQFRQELGLAPAQQTQTQTQASGQDQWRRDAGQRAEDELAALKFNRAAGRTIHRSIYTPEFAYRAFPQTLYTTYGAEHEAPGGMYRGAGWLSYGLFGATAEGVLVDRVYAVGGGVFNPYLNLLIPSGWSFGETSAAAIYPAVIVDQPRAQGGSSGNWECKWAIRGLINRPGGVQIRFTQPGFEDESMIFTRFITVTSPTPQACYDVAPEGQIPGQLKLVSTEGQLLMTVEGDRIVVTHPDGGIERFEKGVLAEAVDRNGNRTLYRRTASPDFSASSLEIVSSTGVTHTYEWKAGLLQTLTKTGIAGARQVYRYSWRNAQARFDEAFPDNRCLRVDPLLPSQVIPCPSADYKALDRIDLPDGTSYEFGYNAWGALSSVKEPGGAFVEYEYGDKNTYAFPLRRPDALGPAISPLDRRRKTQVTRYPFGKGGLIRYVQRFGHEELETIATREINGCSSLAWTRVTHSDGRVERTGVCYGTKLRSNPGGPTNELMGGLGSRVLAREVYSRADDGSRLIEASYFVNLGKVPGESPDRLGVPYSEFGTAISRNTTIANRAESLGAGLALDYRSTRVAHFRDGIWWFEDFSYDASPIEASSQGRGAAQSYGNVATRTLLDASGNKWQESETKYKHQSDAKYVTRNLVRLPAQMKMSGFNGAGQFAVLSHQSMDYDTAGLEASNDDGLDPAWASVRERGNLTVKRQHRVASSDGTPDSASAEMMTTQMRYLLTLAEI